MRRPSLVAVLAGAVAAVMAGSAAVPAQQSGIVTSLTLFAGTAEGLWRSPDWAGSWAPVQGRTAGVRLDGIGPVRAIHTHTNQVWLGGDGGLFFSEDFGETWAPLWVAAGIRQVLPSRWPNADPTLFVGTGNAVLRSPDGGRTFQPTALTGTTVHRLDWPAGALVVACDAGLLVSRDLGAHFEGPGKGLPPGPVRGLTLSSFFSVDPVLFAGPESGGVFRSSDGGATWVASGLADDRVFDMAWLGPFLYAAGEKGFYRSQDAGGTWTRLSESPGRPTRLMFPMAPDAGLEAFLATEQGLFRTTDAGEHWIPAGFAGQPVLTVATFPPPEPVQGKRRR